MPGAADQRPAATGPAGGRGAAAAMSWSCCSTASTGTCSAATAAPSSRRRTSTASPGTGRCASPRTSPARCPACRRATTSCAGPLDFLWRPWGSIEIWEEPITAAAAPGRRHHHAGVGPPAPLRDGRRELPHRLHRLGLRARPRGRPVAHLQRPELHRGAGAAGARRRVVLAGPARLRRGRPRPTTARARSSAPRRTSPGRGRCGRRRTGCGAARPTTRPSSCSSTSSTRTSRSTRPSRGRALRPRLGGRAADLAALRRRRGRRRGG